MSQRVGQQDPETEGSLELGSGRFVLWQILRVAPSSGAGVLISTRIENFSPLGHNWVCDLVVEGVGF